MSSTAQSPTVSDGLETLLSLCAPVRGKAAAWLKARRVFKKTWDAQGFRVVEDYHKVGEGLRARFSADQLRAWGLANTEGNLRFYRHTVLIPYFDAPMTAKGPLVAGTTDFRPVYLQAYAVDPAVNPPMLALSGMTGFSGVVPCPYNARRLDGVPGRLYLCEDVIDTLTLLENGFPAVGLPNAAGFNPEWLPRFKNKTIYVSFGADATGEAESTKLLSLLAEKGPQYRIEAHRLKIPAGKDVNEWLRSGGLGIHLD